MPDRRPEGTASQAVHRIVREESELLDGVAAGLEKREEYDSPSEENVVRELEIIRDQLLRGKLDFYEQSALSTRWNVQSALLKRLRENRAAPTVDARSPYFAHLRLREEGHPRDVCIGRATCLENGVRIVDWRHAPIAKLFYRYRQGEEYEEEVSGRERTGTIEVRRTVTIREGSLLRVDAPEGRFAFDPACGWRQQASEAARLAGGEGAALRFYEGGTGRGRRLGTDAAGGEQRLDRRLPDIAGLIDPAQFELIAQPSAGFVAIRGAAGSGKTTVALHRIAYLAYDDPRIDSPETLFVVFSPALRDYVAHVLPALGVPRAEVATFEEWAARHRRRLFPDLPERRRQDTPALVQRLKLHPVLAVAQQEHARDPGPRTAAQAFDDWASVLHGNERLEELFARRAPDAFSARQLREASAWCRARYEEIAAYLAGDRHVDAELDPEDDALLLRAWQLRVGPIPDAKGAPLRYRHVAIDEVQDFSPNEVRVLLDCLDRHQSLTLAGDTQQHIIQDSGFTSWDSFFAELGVEGTEISTLQVSYRSSREITDFALSLLGDARDPESSVTATRSGPPVECFEFTDPGACVAFLAEALIALSHDEPMASVALLTPSPEVSELYYNGLEQSEVPRLHRVDRQNFRFAPGIEVTEIEQSKGLEFDYVVLVGTGPEAYPDDLAHRRLLHVGATRAIHQLWCLSVGALSPIVSAAASSSRRPEAAA